MARGQLLNSISIFFGLASVGICLTYVSTRPSPTVVANCVSNDQPALEAIARTPADFIVDPGSRDPRGACLTEIATPDSNEISRLLLLIDPRRCERGHCATEIWMERRIGGFALAFGHVVWTRDPPEIDRSAPVPTLRLISRSREGTGPVRLVYSRMFAEYLPIDRGGSPDPPNFRPMRFSLAPAPGDTMALFGSGYVTSDTVDYFEAAVRDLEIEPGSTVYLNSVGGDAAGAIRFGRAIRQYGLKTNVGRPGSSAEYESPRWGACLSACSFAYLGGTERALLRTSQLGFHGPQNIPGMVTGDSNEEVSALVGEGFRVFSARLRAYIQEIGLPSMLTDRILSVPSDQICAPSRNELGALGVLAASSKALPADAVREPMDCWGWDDRVEPAIE